MKISFIIPSRNNLKYLQQAVDSIRKCYGDQHDIVLLDDASVDGTWEWISSLKGSNFIKYRNQGPERVGHTILYDVGVRLCRTEVFTIFHADMVTTPNHVPNLIKHLTRKTVVSATRIEPPLHPPGPEKFVKSFGFEPEEFDQNGLDTFVEEQEVLYNGKITKGIFAPWAMYKEDFLKIGGHDKLFAPMELEDSDIFNRMYLAGYDIVQSRDSFVYHMTCRGSRFKDGIEIEAEIPLPDGTIWYKPKDSEEYKALRTIKFREWARKWASDVLHDEYMMPIVQPRYNVGFKVRNCTDEILRELEPWCDTIYIEDTNQIHAYIASEAPRTAYDLSEKVVQYDCEQNNDIIVFFDAKDFTQTSYRLLLQLPKIIQSSGEIGEFELDIFRITISSMKEYQDSLIVCKN